MLERREKVKEAWVQLEESGVTVINDEGEEKKRIDSPHT